MFLSFSLIFAFFIGVNSKIPCKLQWQTYDQDNFDSIFNISVRTYGSTDYVARAKLDGESYVIGQFNMNHNSALFPNGEKATESAEFDVLTNDFDCNISWVPTTLRDRELDVHADFEDSDSSVVGKAVSSPGVAVQSILSGGISIKGVLLGVDFSTSRSISMDRFYYLQSYTKGFNLVITDFDFEHEPAAAKPQIMGFEYIENNADVFVSQRITHSKTVTQSMSFTETDTTTSSWGVSASASFNHPNFQASLSAEYSEENEQTQSKEIGFSRERRLEITKNVTVAPFTTITVCSTVNFNDDKETKYKATAFYKAKSLTSKEIVPLLSNMGFHPNPGKEGDDFVSVNVSGIFRGSIAIATEFIVTPSEGIKDCKKMLKKGIAKK